MDFLSYLVFYGPELVGETSVFWGYPCLIDIDVAMLILTLHLLTHLALNSIT